MLPPSAFEGSSLSSLAADASGVESSPAPVRDAHGFADTNRAASCLAALRRLTRQPEAGPVGFGLGLGVRVRVRVGINPYPYPYPEPHS